VDALTPYLHGATIALLLLTSAAFARPGAGAGTRFWGAAFAFSVAAYVFRRAPGMESGEGLLLGSAWFLSTVSTALFVLFARSLLIDRPPGPDRIGLGMLGLFTVVSVCGAALPRPVAEQFWILHQTLEFGCYAYVAWLTITGWRGDLDENRRRLRGPLAAIITVYGLLQGVFESLSFVSPTPDTYYFWEALALTVVSFAVPLFILQTRWPRIAPPRAAPATDTPVAEAEGLSTADQLELERVLTLVDTQKAYREEGLTISALAERVRIPEHRLRRLINGGLGFRNYAAFLNARRIAEAKERLADPAQARTPILTLALDLGYGSVGPFNRAFKDATGLTPTEFRRAALSPKAE
jgi:AraC-like DNA-binding protein